MAKFTRAEIRKILGEAHTDEMENALIALHLGVVDPLKDDLEKAQAEAAKLEGVQKELDALKAGPDWKADYDKLKKQFDDFKAETDAKALESAKREAVRGIAKAAGLSDEGVSKAVKYTETSRVELDKDGKCSNADKLRAELLEEWGKPYGVTTTTKGATVETPPADNGKARPSKEDIDKMTNQSERIMAIARNLDQYGQTTK